ncbi:hypothetical protein [Arthrobacter sp. KBS0703]|uniref:hypothetical protein n=1 Tax=Arthrobacter sp. KBS0703 TaxID=1955698 RepID=UPI0021B10E85|nr:hypothetical protein [Arthrobacter sp. KBS0703]
MGLQIAVRDEADKWTAVLAQGAKDLPGHVWVHGDENSQVDASTGEFDEQILWCRAVEGDYLTDLVVGVAGK